MAHLTKPERYNIEDTNIALLGSDVRHYLFLCLTFAYGHANNDHVSSKSEFVSMQGIKKLLGRMRERL